MSFGNLLGVLCFEEDAKGYLVCAPLKLKIRKTLTKEQLQLLKHIKGVIGCYNSILEGKLSPEELDKELQDHGSSQILS